MDDNSTALWLREHLSAHDSYIHGIRRVLLQTRTRYQDMWLVDTHTFGRALLLDGKWQSCTADEHLYHEPLVHVPALVAALAGQAPRRVLILGGGEGATAREILRWRSVERVVMVDIDGEVVDACRTHLEEMHQGAFDDPRVELVIGDALTYLAETDPVWDLVISDLSEPVEDGPSYPLFTREHFQDVSRVLAPGGVFVLQAGSLSHHELYLHARLARTVSAVFDHVVSYQSAVPSFATPWGYLVARSGAAIDTLPDPAAVDAILAAQLTQPARMMDGATYVSLLQTQGHIRRAIEAETRIYTRDDPPKLPDLARAST